MRYFRIPFPKSRGLMFFPKNSKGKISKSQDHTVYIFVDVYLNFKYLFDFYIFFIFGIFLRFCKILGNSKIPRIFRDLDPRLFYANTIRLEIPGIGLGFPKTSHLLSTSFIYLLYRFQNIIWVFHIPKWKILVF